MSHNEVMALIPYIILTVTGCVGLLLEVSGVPIGARKTTPRTHITLISMLGAATAAVFLGARLMGPLAPELLFHGAIRVDAFGLFFGVVVCLAAIFSLMVAVPYLRARDLDRGEYYAIILFATLGMVALAQAADLLFLFVALETLSVGVYVLAGLDRSNSRSPEGALKYFINGAFAAAILLFGMALVYGGLGTTQLQALGDALRGGAAARNPLVIAGFVMILGGLAFKVAAVPFHMWTPDVYEGAPAPSTAFMAAGVKAAAFAALLRVLISAMGPGAPASAEGWLSLAWGVAVATMTLGNLAALAQRRVKRMLAYSSIAHAGYALAGVVAVLGGQQQAIGAIGFYLLAYAVMTVGAFGVVGFLEREEGRGATHEEWAGAARRYPVIGLAMAVFMFSLTGIPPTVGFLAKLNLFSRIVDAGFYWLAFFAILNSLVSVYYYLRVLVFMYMKDPHPKLEGRGGSFLSAGLAVTALLVLLLGVMPGAVLSLASRMIDVVAS